MRWNSLPLGAHSSVRESYFKRLKEKNGMKRMA